MIKFVPFRPVTLDIYQKIQFISLVSTLKKTVVNKPLKWDEIGETYCSLFCIKATSNFPPSPFTVLLSGGR